MNTCQHCGSTRWVKDGHNRSGSQRYACRACGRITTPQPTPNGYRPEVRAQLDGVTFQTAWSAGRQMTLEQAMVDALEDDG